MTAIYCRYSGFHIGDTDLQVWPQEKSWPALHPIFSQPRHQLDRLYKQGNRTPKQQALLLLAYSNLTVGQNIHISMPIKFADSHLRLHFHPAIQILAKVAALPATRQQSLLANCPHFSNSECSNPLESGHRFIFFLVDHIFPAVAATTTILDDLADSDHSGLSELWLADHTIRKGKQEDRLAQLWNYAFSELRSTFQIPESSFDSTCLAISNIRRELDNPTQPRLLKELRMHLAGMREVAASAYQHKLAISTVQLDQVISDLDMKLATINRKTDSVVRGLAAMHAPAASLDLDLSNLLPISSRQVGKISVQFDISTPTPEAQHLAAGSKSTELIERQQRQLEKQVAQKQDKAASAILHRFGLSGIDFSKL